MLARAEDDLAYAELLASLACAFRALKDPHCLALLGPHVPGATLTQGARVPGTSLELEPARAAFNLGAMMAGSALAAILPVADYLARKAHNEATAPPCLGEVLAAMDASQRVAAADAATAGLMQFLGASAAQRAAALRRCKERCAETPTSRRAWAEASAASVRIAFEVMPDTTEWRTSIPPRRAAGLRSVPAAEDFFASVEAHFPAVQAALVRARFSDPSRLIDTPVHEWVALLVRNG